jgi:hypothetical protein
MLALTERRAAYYQVLHEHPAFEAALHKLFRNLTPPARLRSGRKLTEPGKRERAHWTRDEASVRAFARQWALPADGPRDVWACFYAACEGLPLRLRALLPPGDRETVRVETVQITPDPFTYDPRVDPRLAVDDYLVTLRRHLVKQARDHRADLWAKTVATFRRHLPRRFRTRAQSIVQARRLYRHAVENRRRSQATAC